MIDVTFTERQLWSRILSEAEQAAAEDSFLGGLIADSFRPHGTLPDAIVNRVADVISPADLTARLHKTLSALLGQNPSILSSVVFDVAAVLEIRRQQRRYLQFFMQKVSSALLQGHRTTSGRMRHRQEEMVCDVC